MKSIFFIIDTDNRQVISVSNYMECIMYFILFYLVNIFMALKHKSKNKYIDGLRESFQFKGEVI